MSSQLALTHLTTLIFSTGAQQDKGLWIAQADYVMDAQDALWFCR